MRVEYFYFAIAFSKY